MHFYTSYARYICRAAGRLGGGTYSGCACCVRDDTTRRDQNAHAVVRRGR